MPLTPEERLDRLEDWRRDDMAALTVLRDRIRARFADLRKGRLRPFGGGRAAPIPGTLTAEDRRNLDWLAAERTKAER